MKRSLIILLALCSLVILGQSIEHLCDFDGNWWEYSYQKNSCLQADNDITCFECESLTYLLDMEYGLEDQKPVQPLPDVEYTFETLSPSQRQPPRIVTKGSLEIGNRIGEGKIEEPLTRLESTSLTSTKTVPKTSTAKRGQDESFNSEQRTTKQSVSGNDAAGDLTKQSVLGEDVGGAPGAPGDVSAIKTGSPATAIAETSTSGRVGETTMSTGVPTQRETINVVVAKKILKQKTTATPGTTIATSQVITTTQLLPSITQGIVTAEKAVTQTEVTMRTSSANQIIISFPETIPIATTSSQETVSTQEKTLKTSGMTENTSTQETIPEITVTGQEIIGIGQLPTKKSIKKVISQKSTAEKTTESQTTEPFTAGQGIGAMKIATGVTKIAASKKVAGVKKTTVGMIIAKKTLASTDTLNPVSEGADAGLGITSNPEEIIQKSTTSKKVVTKKTVAGKAVKSQTTGAIKIATGVTKMGASKKVAGAKKTTVGMIIAKKTLASTDTTNLVSEGADASLGITSNPEEIIQKSTTSKKVVTKKTIAGKAVKSQTTGAIKIATGVTKIAASKKVAGVKKTTVGMIIAKKTLASTDTSNPVSEGADASLGITSNPEEIIQKSTTSKKVVTKKTIAGKAVKSQTTGAIKIATGVTKIAASKKVAGVKKTTVGMIIAKKTLASTDTSNPVSEGADASLGITSSPEAIVQKSTTSKKVVTKKTIAGKAVKSQNTTGAVKIASGVTKMGVSKKVTGVKKTTVGMVIAKKTLASTDTSNPVSEGADASLGITSSPEAIVQKSTTSKKVVTKKTIAGKAVKSQNTTGAMKIASGVTKMGVSKKVTGVKKTTAGMVIAKKTLASTDTLNPVSEGADASLGITSNPDAIVQKSTTSKKVVTKKAIAGKAVKSQNTTGAMKIASGVTKMGVSKKVTGVKKSTAGMVIAKKTLASADTSNPVSEGADASLGITSNPGAIAQKSTTSKKVVTKKTITGKAVKSQNTTGAMKMASGVTKIAASKKATGIKKITAGMVVAKKTLASIDTTNSPMGNTSVTLSEGNDTNVGLTSTLKTTIQKSTASKKVVSKKAVSQKAVKSQNTTGAMKIASGVTKIAASKKVAGIKKTTAGMVIGKKTLASTDTSNPSMSNNSMAVSEGADASIGLTSTPETIIQNSTATKKTVSKKAVIQKAIKSQNTTGAMKIATGVTKTVAAKNASSVKKTVVGKVIAQKNVKAGIVGNQSIAKSSVAAPITAKLVKTTKATAQKLSPVKKTTTRKATTSAPAVSA